MSGAAAEDIGPPAGEGKERVSMKTRIWQGSRRDRVAETLAVLNGAFLILALGAVRAADRVVAPGASVRRVATGFRFTEGPAADARGDVYFTDVPASEIHTKNCPTIFMT